jgi:hypothetical protein
MVSISAQTNGAGQFDFELEGLSPGTAYYLVTEAPGSYGTYWNYDETVYIVKITVTPGPDGELIPSVEYRFKMEESDEWGEWIEWGEPSGNAGYIVTFTNLYKPSGAEITIDCTKTVSTEGAGAPNKTFTFTVTQTDADGTDYTGGNPVALPPPAAVGTAREDDYEFSLYINGLADDTYYFLISETGDGGDGWGYDTAQRIVTVTVIGGEAAVIEYRAIESSGEIRPVDGVTFINTYTQTGGPAFPETGGAGTEPYITIVIILTTLLSVFFIGTLIYRNSRR